MNIQHLLRLERPILFFDLETTGPNSRVDRIVEIGLIQIRPDGSTKEWRSLVNPEMPISKEATEKHGIDADRLTKCNRCATSAEEHPHQYGSHLDASLETCEVFLPIPTFGQIAENLLRGFSNTDFGGYNIKTFDLPVMKAEFEREGHKDWSYDDAKLIDGFRLWQVAEPRTLSDFVQRWSKRKHVDAHTALADIRGTLGGIIDCITEVQHLPRDINQLHELLWPPRPRDPNWIDKEGKFAWKNGVAIVNFGKKWNQVAIHKVSRRFWEWMVDPQQNFPADAIHIAREAMAGRLPKQEVSSAATDSE